eukprot:2493363-Amphidinium_carterae.2
MDDILLFASSVQSAERMVADVAIALHHCGLQLNVSKTVWAASSTIPEQSANFGGQAVERSESIKFLGSVYCPANPSDEDVQPRISASWRVFHKWKPMLVRKTLDLNLRLRLLRATVFAALEWGFSSWHVSIPSLRHVLAFVNMATAAVLRTLWQAPIWGQRKLVGAPHSFSEGCSPHLGSTE